ncbi:ATP-dependent RNA helicase HrpA [Actinomarinicola tropica]|uniref:ATP-dependent RNA helicase HrpA n=1 Tax=Actinomarinicola tropica TaxID=2789776 RepID=A0A5Q2RDP8_9ACTN|nr:ATP-dependent RNA helicase HrpA [Actinomarinicola tropica]QGG95009.1 ATP-dependent RNA helicase HrpA [Actinomarinicola tropica]
MSRLDPAEIERRRALLPTPRYPEELPISQRRGDLLDALRDNQVVVVAGETGSGKSTQLPKLCLELGRGVEGLIAHTQPRRIAARSIAERMAEELGTEVGGLVGYAVRFTDEVGPDTLLKLMTDGILLAEIQRDRDLRRYDTIIVDEAHERSLNIDFLLGYLRQLLPRRPDLKVVITSATIDTERFSQHFGGAPIVEVSGRTYPVEIRYRPLEDPDDVEAEVRDQPQGIVDAVEELRREGPGDVLVFCAGERDIRDAADALRDRAFPDTEILPLYARLSAAEQHRVFAPHTGRRIVLATNVAETSLTVPGIRSVVDPGNARISRFNHRTKVQRLPIEDVSQASADQRAGRCGRIGPGTCIRLYSEESYDARPRFTEPEIQRTNLASVILQMAAIGLGEIERFPFVDPPDARAVRDGIALLVELGAVDPEHEGTRRWLTPLGRQLARLPLDPRLGRMVLAAHESGCLHEVAVIAAGLSIIDPRERPSGKEQEAAQLHARFAHPDSDFLSLLALWEHVREVRRDRSSNQWRKQLKAEHLNVMRVREWQDVYAQLRQVCGQMGMRMRHGGEEPSAATIHQALLTGLLSHVGMRIGDTRDYRGARGATFAIAPGSVLSRARPRWVMAGELVETNRMWGRMVARIQPEWLESAGAHLVKRSYGEPWWDAERGAASTTERVTLFGLPVVAGRTTNLARVDPERARELVIWHALVHGEWTTHHRFVERNRARVEEVHDLEARARRDLLLPDEALFDWFDERVPDHVVSVRSFDKWWKGARRDTPDLLDVPLDVLVSGSDAPDPDDFPDEWRHGDLTLDVAYEFDPSSLTDGAVIEVPLAALNQIDPDAFEWSVPGVRPLLVDALVRSLPKSIRRSLVPVPDTVAAVLDHLDTAAGDGLLRALARELRRTTGVEVTPEDFDLDKVPDHLRPTVRVVDEAGRPIAQGKSVEALGDLLDRQVRTAISQSGPSIERTGLTDWPGGDLPSVIDTTGAGHVVRAYPALVDEGDTVAVRLLPSQDEQWEAMWVGTRALLGRSVPAVVRAVTRMLTNRSRLALAVSPWRSEQDWALDVVGAAVDGILDEQGGPSWTEEGWRRLRAATAEQLPKVLVDVAPVAVDVLDLIGRIVPRLDEMDQKALAPSVADVREQLGRLVYPSVLTSIGAPRVADLRRYLRAIEHRLDKLPDGLRKDQERMVAVRRLEQELDALAERVPASPELDRATWMLQELRVASFAQHLGTTEPVSDKRVRAALAAAAGQA